MLSIGVGQAGIQQTDTLWQLLCAEHGVAECGLVDDDDVDDSCRQHERSRVFQQTRVDRHVPHCIMVDTDADAIAALRHAGARRDLYHRGRLIHGVGGDDGAGTFARAQTVGRECVAETIEAARLLLEQSDAPCSGVLLARASGGGTGAGLGSLLLECFSDGELGDDVPVLDLCTVPSERLSTAVTEPYNAVLAASDAFDLASASVLLENEAVFRNCTDALHVRAPGFDELNQVWAHVVSSLSAPFRFGLRPLALATVCSALVPQPRRNALVSHFAPLVPRDRIEHERLAFVDLTRHIFDVRCSQSGADVLRARSTAAAWLVYRGVADDALGGDTDSALADALAAFPSVRGEPTLRYSHVEPVSCGIAGGAIAAAPRSLCALTNSSAAKRILQAQLRKFDRLLSKRAFLHWYEAEGVELAQFVDARHQVIQFLEL